MGLAAASCLVGAALSVAAGTAATADTIDNDGFESFTTGQIVGQGGWTAHDLGGYAASGFDLEVVDPTAGAWPGGELGSRALRLSNAVTSNAFGNQLQTPSLVDEAGEAAAVNGGESGGARQSRLTGSLTFASATRAYQPGLRVTFSPDRGDGTRMAFFVIADEPAGLSVSVSVLDETIPDFVTHTVATGLSRDEVHTLDFTLDLVDGESNDVLWAQVGGQCGSWAESGSWETYHRVYGGGDTQTVDSLLFRISGTAAPATLGGGFLLDDVSLTSSTVPPMPPLGVPAAPAAPTAHVSPSTVTVTGTPVATNACAPVTEYTVTAWPLNTSLPPQTFTGTSPNLTFPTPFGGAFTLTLSATNSEGRSAESATAAVTIDPVFAGDGELAFTGPRDAGGLGAASVALVAAGVALLLAAGRRVGEA